ncbi:VOC family protein [Lentzea cavernae]|nr:VOC family protein [Lentzea cavernae]
MDLKTRDPAATATFFSHALGWSFAVDEEDWRTAVKISADGHQIGSVSDLASPVYPPGTPAHIAFYLAVDDVDRQVAAAVANGADLVVPAFEAGDQGRIATLIDPFGAAFSLWRQHRPTAWTFPHRMVLESEQPGEARRFYEETLGGPLPGADFLAAPGPVTPRWELALADPHSASGSAARLSSPEGLAFRTYG